ncbi:MAG: chloride channel protein [Bacilli bacterium]
MRFYVCQSASGSGIPQTKAAYYNNFGLLSWRDAVQRFVLGSIFCGLGNSAAARATVHLCSAAASAMAQNFGFPKKAVRDAVPQGWAQVLRLALTHRCLLYRLYLRNC